jgi:hypothetical protein
MTAFAVLAVWASRRHPINPVANRMAAASALVSRKYFTD